MDLVAVGRSVFLPGFALAGVRTMLAHNSEEAVRAFRSAPSGSVLIIEEEIVRDLDTPQRAQLENSADPLVILLSPDTKAQDERLRRSIRSTLGVDLLEARR